MIAVVSRWGTGRHHPSGYKGEMEEEKEVEPESLQPRFNRRNNKNNIISQLLSFVILLLYNYILRSVVVERKQSREEIISVPQRVCYKKH
jgi:hypothetical protein